LLIQNSNSNTFTNISQNSSPYGVYLISSNNTALIGSNFSRDTWGMSLLGSDSETLTENNLLQNTYALQLENITNTSIYDNEIIYNDYGLYVINVSNSSLYNNSIRSNILFNVWSGVPVNLSADISGTCVGNFWGHPQLPYFWTYSGSKTPYDSNNETAIDPCPLNYRPRIVRGQLLLHPRGVYELDNQTPSILLSFDTSSRALYADTTEPSIPLNHTLFYYYEDMSGNFTDNSTFDEIWIPAGASITSAVMNVSSNGSTNLNITLEGQTIYNSSSFTGMDEINMTDLIGPLMSGCAENPLHHCGFAITITKGDNVSWVALSNLKVSYEYASGLKAPQQAANISQYLSPRSDDHFTDGSTVAPMNFSASADPNLNFINYTSLLIPKSSLLHSITLTINSYDNLTLLADILNDSIIDWNSIGDGQIAMDTTSFLSNCTPSSYGTEGPMCVLPVAILSNDTGSINMSVNYSFTNIPWQYAGTEARIQRGSQVLFDAMDFPAGDFNRNRTAKLEHHSFQALQVGDVVSVYTTDLAGNRNSSSFTIPQAPAQPPPPTETRHWLIANGSLYCAGETAAVSVYDEGMVLTDASVSVTYGGSQVASGNSGSNGLFTFIAERVGSYSVSISKGGYTGTSLTLTANDCGTGPASIRSSIIRCEVGQLCNLVIDADTQKLTNVNVDLSSFTGILSGVFTILDQYSQTVTGFSYSTGTLILQSITSTFNVQGPTTISVSAIGWESGTNRANASILNVGQDASISSISIPLPPEMSGRQISRVLYQPAGASAPIEITQYHIENGYIVIDQQIEIKRT
jgi:parallel beta-helix repeat protein